jgi:hypothetical protein
MELDHSLHFLFSSTATPLSFSATGLASSSLLHCLLPPSGSRGIEVRHPEKRLFWRHGLSREEEEAD